MKQNTADAVQRVVGSFCDGNSVQKLICAMEWWAHSRRRKLHFWRVQTNLRMILDTTSIMCVPCELRVIFVQTVLPWGMKLK